MKNYIALAKPGIIFGNGISVVAGYFFAQSQSFDFVLFLSALLGISLVIAGGGAFNNVVDRDIDSVMERTKTRPMVLGKISVTNALIFATVSSVLGFVVLAVFTNWLTVIVAAVGLFVYVLLYTLWLKRSSIHGTLIGSISGAVPPLVGYCAVANKIDTQSILLVLALCFWQMPHSYAIAIFRAKDFTLANIPLLPLLTTAFKAKIVMLLYSMAFALSLTLIFVLNYAGLVFAILMGLGALAWLAIILRGFFITDDQRWAKQVFFGSIIVVTVLSVSMVFNHTYI